MNSQHRIALEVDERGTERSPQPVAVSIPFAPGAVRTLRQIGLVGEADAPLPRQVRTLAQWPDGSLRWIQLEFLWRPGVPYAVLLDEGLAAVPAEESETASHAMLVRPTVSDKGELQLQSEAAVPDCSVDICLRHDGRSFKGTLSSWRPQRCGPVTSVWSASLAFHDAGGASPLVGHLSCQTYAELPVCQFELMVRNPQAMNHPGGNWDLGAAGNILIEELAVRLRPHAGSSAALETVELEVEPGEPAVTAQHSVAVLQASSGGENWNSRNHLDASGKVPLPFKGFQWTADQQRGAGARATPIVRRRAQATQISLAVKDFWQNFPKQLSADAEGLEAALFPASSGHLHELQGGEQKTHALAVEFGAESSELSGPSELSGSSEPCLRWYHHPVRVSLRPSDYAAAQALAYLCSDSDSGSEAYERLVDLAIEGDDTFADKAEAIDEYGWRHFGDLYGDHEAVFDRGEAPMISHYNNQYDCTLAFAIHFLRRGDWQWFDLMTRMADHAWDIDTYHTDDDKLLYNHGLFWHTYHYADAHTSTHRSYPKQLRLSQSFEGGQELSELGETGSQLEKNYAIGGGPAAAHNYSTGWMVAYWLTGQERYRTAAISAAEYVMRIEDGRQTPFRWLCRSDTGYSTCSSEGYYGPGRAAANSTHALLTGHELTGDPRYLERAARLMRRTVHPAQDLDALDLLNAELRWFYTMYLQALGRFVDYKDSLGQRDDDFHYAVTTLLHYANWMAEHERPTLSAPDQLQYPTETWAAQDMRKWHVLEHAASYQADAELRARYHRKADYFFEHSLQSLSQFETRSLCRPIILILNFGWQRAWFLQHRNTPRIHQQISEPHGKQVPFVPQRTIAIRRFKRLLGLSVAATAAAFAGIVYLLIRSSLAT